jgi:PTS system cellobiose-specific IIC component
MNSNNKNKMVKFLEDKLAPIGIKVGKQRYMVAIKNSFISTIPLTIVGGLSLLLASPPVDPKLTKPTNIFSKFLLNWYYWAKNNNEMIISPFNMTMGIIALFVAISIAYNLAKIYSEKYNMDPLSSGVISGAIFLLIASPSKKGMMATRFLDAKGFFTAIIVGILTVEITRFLIKHNIAIKMPEGVPPEVAASFTALIPLAVNIIIFYTINLILGKAFGTTIPETIIKVLTPVINGTDSVIFVMTMMLISHSLWLVGIHGGSITGTITTTVYTANLMANAAAVAAGEPMPRVMTGPVSVFVVVMGGAGATLGFTFLLLRSKSSQLKAVGKAGILPSLFGINEPILFGTPLILNPILAIPFVCTPLVNAILGFYSTKFGLIGKAYIAVPWTTPPFIGLPLATMDWRALILVVVVLFIDMGIYYPFFKVYERISLEKEKGKLDNPAA